MGVREIAEWPLFDDELPFVRSALPRRRREFSTGRALLRQLIDREIPIPVGTDRAPILPSDLLGSLAHDDDFAVAAVGRSEYIQSIGIDIDSVDPLDDGTAALILRPDEAGIDAHLAFTLKEATYKAWSGLGGRMLDHHEVHLVMGSATFRAEVIPDSTRFDGAYARAGKRWLALVVVARR